MQENLAEIDSIKREHDVLYTKMLRDRQAHPENFKNKQNMDEYRGLVRQLRVMAQTAEYVDDYAWFANAVVQWQIAFSTVLEEPLDLNTVLKDGFSSVLEAPLDRLIPDPPKGLRTSYPDTELTKRVEKYADLVSLFRRLSRESTDQERLSDWHQGEAIFSADVLDGNIDFVQKVGTDAFNYLEAAWLNEIIQIKAYFRYEQRKRRGEQPNDDKQNYYFACEYYRWRLISSRSKYGQQYFSPMAAYLRTQFLKADDKLDPVRAEELIRRKAKRYHDRRVFGDAAEDWTNAERYVQAFYENIIQAVGCPGRGDPGTATNNGSEAAKRRLVDAILSSEGPESPLSIMNAFEAAIAIYFFKDPKGLPEAWYRQASSIEEKLRKEEAAGRSASAI